METAYYDKTFRPNLLNAFISKRERDWLKKWGMDTVGIPAPMPRNMKAAVWAGAASLHGEAPVLAVITEPPRGAKADQNIWYMGMAETDMSNNQPLTIDEYLMAAEFGPHRLLEALELLVIFAPLERYESTQGEPD